MFLVSLINLENDFEKALEIEAREAVCLLVAFFCGMDGLHGLFSGQGGRNKKTATDVTILHPSMLCHARSAIKEEQQHRNCESRLVQPLGPRNKIQAIRSIFEQHSY